MRWWLLVLLVLMPFACAETYFSEVMYNPLGSDTGFEWVEVYSNDSLEITSCKFLEAGVNHGITLSSNGTSSYFVIADVPSKFLGNYSYNGTLYDSAFSLSNTGEALSFVCDGITIAFVNYTDIALEGDTLQFISSEWVSGVASPGYLGLKTEVPNETLPEAVNESVSFIKIDKVDANVTFGSVLDVKFTAHKGDTSKYAVYVWVDGASDKSQVNMYTKLSDGTFTIPVQLRPNCDGRYDEGDYTLRISGLGVEVNASVHVSGINTKLCKVVEKTVTKTTGSSCPATSSFEYSLVGYPTAVLVGLEFKTLVKIVNNYDYEIPVKVWSYVYRGSKTYSGEREENMISFDLDSGDEKIIELKNTVEDALSGDYKLKVLINKKDQKTNQELTSDISIFAIPVAENKTCAVCPTCSSAEKSVSKEIVMSGAKAGFGYENVASDVISDGIVYESDALLQKKAVPMFLSLVGLLGVGLFKYKFEEGE